MTDVDTAALAARLATRLDLPCAQAWVAGGNPCAVPPSGHEDRQLFLHPYQPPDLTTWEGMGMVLEAMVARGYSYSLTGAPDGYSTAGFSVGTTLRSGFVTGTLPLAIALAADAAREAEGGSEEAMAELNEAKDTALERAP